MAKKVKFSLILGGQSIRTLDELQHHFYIVELLEHYYNDKLQRWLKARGYDEHYQQIAAIKDKQATAIIAKLCHIFDMTKDDQELNKAVKEYEQYKQYKLSTGYK